MSQVKILFPYSRGRIGGSYFSSAQLAAALKDNENVFVRLLAPRGCKAESIFNRYTLSVDNYPDFTSWMLNHESGNPVFTRLKKRMARHYFKSYLALNPFDIIHFHDDTSYFLLCDIAKASGAKVIWHIRQEKRRREDAQYLSFSDRIIFISKGCAYRFGHFRLDPAKTKVIYNGIVLSEFSLVTPETRSVARRSLGVPDNAFVLAFVGNFAARKRPEWCLHVLARFLRKGINAYLVYAGENRKKQTFLDESVFSRGRDVVERALFLGQCDNVSKVYHAADLVLVPSEPHGEPFSRVVAEASACGVPVLASKGTGALELLQHNVNCYESVSTDPETFAAEVESLVTNPVEMSRIAFNARNAAITNFSHARMSSEILEFYREILL